MFVILERLFQSKAESNQTKYLEQLVYSKFKTKNTWRNKKTTSREILLKVAILDFSYHQIQTTSS